MVQWRPREWMPPPQVIQPRCRTFCCAGKEMSGKCRGLLWEPPQMKCWVVLVSQQVTTLVWSRFKGGPGNDLTM